MALDFRLDNEVICSCGMVIFEADSIFCGSCGDMACKDCYTDCLTCGKMFCSNCSQNIAQCIKCHEIMNKSMKKADEKAFLVIGGKTTPVKNSLFMIEKTSIPNARDIVLNFGDKEYRYLYRAHIERDDNSRIFDYFLYFEEQKPIDKISKAFEQEVKNLFDSVDDIEYDDYSTLNWSL